MKDFVIVTDYSINVLKNFSQGDIIYDIFNF